MKTLSLELSKRLAPFLEGVETEYIYYDWEIYDEYELSSMWDNIIDFNIEILTIKTLTLEEAIEFLISKSIVFTHICLPLTNDNNHAIREINFMVNWELWEQLVWGDKEDWYFTVEVYWKTLLEAIEAMILYLLNANLFTW